MQLLSRIAGILLLFPVSFSVYAETIDLVCIDATGFSVNFEIDTHHNVVITGGIQARRVFVDKGVINFVLVFNGKNWFHSINRTTGSMIVQGPDKSSTDRYMCEKAKPKF